MNLDRSRRPRQAWIVGLQEEFRARLAEGAEFAPSLLGLDRDTAVQRVRSHGFRPEVIPPTPGLALTAELASGRIRLFLDEDDMVARASSG